MPATDVRYNVVCMECGQVFQPAVRSSLWWKAKKRDKQGFLDALPVCGEECGCVEKQHHPDALFRVFGYYGPGEDFDVACAAFVEAIRNYRYADRNGAIVFITGVSEAVEDKLRYP